MAIGSSTEIGIRVFLDDLAGGGLIKINGLLQGMGHSANGAKTAFMGLTQQMLAMSVIGGFATALGLFGGAIKYSVDQAASLQQAMFNVAVATHVPMSTAMQYTQQLMTLGATSNYTSADIADGIAQLGRAGYGIADIFKNMATAGVALGVATRSTAVQGFQLLAQSMAAYRAPASEAMHYADLLQYAFEHQRGSVSDLLSGLSQVTPVAGSLKLPFDEVVAALDTLGPAMKSTSVAGTALRYTIAGLYEPNAKQQTELVKLKLATVDAGGAFHSVFYDAHGKAVDFTTAIEILNTKLKGMSLQAKEDTLTSLFSIKGGQGAMAMLQGIQTYLGYVKQLKQTQDNAGGAMQRWQQQQQNFSFAMSALGTSVKDLGAAIGLNILPAATAFVNALNRIVSAVRSSVLQNPQAAVLFLKLGVAISAIGLVAAIAAAAFMSLLPPIFAIALVIVGVVVGVTLLALGLTLLIGWIRQTAGSATPLGQIFRDIGAVFREIGAYVQSAFVMAWKMIQPALAPLGPAFAQLGSALRPLLPVLGGIAAIIGGVVVGAIHGLIAALAFLVVGIVHVISGIVLVLTGILTVAAGFYTLLIGLITGNGAKIKQGFQSMLNGVLQIFTGILHIIIGLFTAVFGTILGFVVGFVQGIIQWFQHLANVLVGHSIVPDMMNAIRNVITTVLNAVGSFILGFILRAITSFIQLGVRVVQEATMAFTFFRQVAQAGLNAVVGFISGGVANMLGHIVAFGAGLVSRGQSAFGQFGSIVSSGVSAAVNFIGGLPGKAVAALAGLGSMLFQSGMNAMQQFANGLTSVLGAVVGAVQKAAGAVANFLAHHSPAKMGPLADDDKWMPNMVRMMAQGLESNIPLLQSAANKAAGGIASAPSTARMATPYAGMGGAGGGQMATLQPINLVVDGKVLTQVVLNNLTGQMQLNGLGRAFK